MDELTSLKLGLIGIIFVWSGFVRSGLGFGGAVLSLPFLLLIDNRPLVYLPLIAVHLLFFSSLTLYQSYRNRQRSDNAMTQRVDDSVDWRYLLRALAIMIVPKLMGVLGLLTLSPTLMSSLVFSIVSLYSLSYILNKPFKSRHPLLDTLFLILGGYISGTSLIGAPLVIAVFAQHVDKHRLRNTLFVLWFILVSIKMMAFIIAGIDLQLIHHLWLLPCAALGHVIGLRFHDYLLTARTQRFYPVLGSVLLSVSIIGLIQLY